jgi:hypothetical protein
MSDIRLLPTFYFSFFTSYFVWHPRQSAIYPDESHMKIFKLVQFDFIVDRTCFEATSLALPNLRASSDLFSVQ